MRGGWDQEKKLRLGEVFFEGQTKKSGVKERGLK